MIPRRLRELRLRYGYSQEYVGVNAGIDVSTARSRISHYESGTHTPDFGMMQRISAVFNVPVSYFYTPEDELAEFILHFYDKN